MGCIYSNNKGDNKSIQVDDNSNRTLNKNKETISTNKEEEKSTEIGLLLFL